MKGRPQNDEGDRTRGCGDLSEGLHHDFRHRDSNNKKQCSDDCSLYHGIFENVPHESKGRDLSSPEYFKSHDAQDIVYRHDNSNHHGCHGDIFLAEKIRYQGNAQKDKIASVYRLYHGAAAFVRGLKARHKEKGHNVDNGKGA